MKKVILNCDNLDKVYQLSERATKLLFYMISVMDEDNVVLFSLNEAFYKIKLSAASLHRGKVELLEKGLIIDTYAKEDRRKYYRINTDIAYYEKEDIDNLNIDDLFKDNTNNKKMKNKKYTFCKIFELEDRQILIEKNYNDEDDYKIKVSTSDGEILTSLSLGFLKEEEADKYFDSITEEEVLRCFKNIGVIKN